MNKGILESYPDIITTKELKEILNIGNNKLYYLLNNGYIKSFTLGTNGRSRRILKSDLIDYISNSLSSE